MEVIPGNIITQLAQQMEAPVEGSVWPEKYVEGIIEEAKINDDMFERDNLKELYHMLGIKRKKNDKQGQRYILTNNVNETLNHIPL